MSSFIHINDASPPESVGDEAIVLDRDVNFDDFIEDSHKRAPETSSEGPQYCFETTLTEAQLYFVSDLPPFCVAMPEESTRTVRSLESGDSALLTFHLWGKLAADGYWKYRGHLADQCYIVAESSSKYYPWLGIAQNFANEPIAEDLKKRKVELLEQYTSSIHDESTKSRSIFQTDRSSPASELCDVSARSTICGDAETVSVSRKRTDIHAEDGFPYPTRSLRNRTFKQIQPYEADRADYNRAKKGIVTKPVMDARRIKHANTRRIKSWDSSIASTISDLAPEPMSEQLCTSASASPELNGIKDIRVETFISNLAGEGSLPISMTGLITVKEFYSKLRCAWIFLLRGQNCAIHYCTASITCGKVTTKRILPDSQEVYEKFLGYIVDMCQRHGTGAVRIEVKIVLRDRIL